MKYTKYIGMVLVASGILAATSCTDFSDYNTAPESADLSADKTLWENISANPNLSQFASVLKRVGYDKVLSESHTYTVWAPVNGSFNVDSLANISDAKVIGQFVKNHIADFSHLENDVKDTTIYMLNEKLLPFRNKLTSNLTFDGQALAKNGSVYNYPSVNGTLYVMNRPATFRYNGYEFIAEQEKLADSLMNYVAKYESSYLDESKSVKGEIRDGVQHYDDSVMVVVNSLTLGRLNAQIDNEDSLYTVLIPNNGAWNSSYDRIKEYYNYITPIAYQDLSDPAVGQTKGGTCPTTSTGRATIMSAATGSKTTTLAAAPVDAVIADTKAYWSDSIAKTWMVKNITFSETNKKYNSKLTTDDLFVDNDTLYSTTRNRLTNLPYLDQVTERVVPLSNGHARIITGYPFYSWETYAPVLRTRQVSRIVTATGSTWNNVNISGLPSSIVQFEDDVKDGVLRYVKATLPSTANAAPEMDFYINNVLSTTYDVYLVVVPAWLDNLDNPEFVRKPYTLRVDINYTNEKNQQVTGRFDGETIQTEIAQISKVKAFEVGKEKIDTVKLGRITFPICYANTEARPNIKVMSTLSTFNATNKRKYESELRIANIILKPMDVVENEKNARKED